jgi:hypothetical protein
VRECLRGPSRQVRSARLLFIGETYPELLVKSLDTLTGYPLGALSHTQRLPGRWRTKNPLPPRVGARIHEDSPLPWAGEGKGEGGACEGEHTFTNNQGYICRILRILPGPIMPPIRSAIRPCCSSPR